VKRGACRIGIDYARMGQSSIWSVQKWYDTSLSKVRITEFFPTDCVESRELQDLDESTKDERNENKGYRCKMSTKK